MTREQQRQLGGTEPDEVITPGKRTLSQCEAAAERGLASFGEALLEIKQRQLYKVAAGNWDDYCEQRWGINGRTANRQIQQARAMADLPPGSEVPSQREIARRAGESRTRASENRGRKSQDDAEGDEVPPTLGAPPDAPVSAGESEAPPPEPPTENEPPAPTQAPPVEQDAPPPPAQPSPATPAGKDEQVHAIFDRFFASDPRAVAEMSDVKVGLARGRVARKWVDAYEMAVKGIPPLAAVTPLRGKSPAPLERSQVTPNFKGAKK